MAGSKKGRRVKRSARYFLNCGWCGGGFSATRFDAVFCSPACRQADKRRMDRIEKNLGVTKATKAAEKSVKGGAA